MTFTNAMQKVTSEELTTGTIDYAIQHPLCYIMTTRNNGNWLAIPDHTLWGRNKTLYDPCPAGWKVPSADEEPWSNVNPNRVADPYYGVYLDGGRAWYPNNGYINTSASLLMVGQYSCYWTSSQNGQAVYAMEMSQVPNNVSGFSLTFNPRQYGKVRGEGHSVRCIEDK